VTSLRSTFVTILLWSCKSDACVHLWGDSNRPKS
jgi:hypothetical protein